MAIEFQFPETVSSKIRKQLRELGFTDEDFAKDVADGVALTAAGMQKADRKHLELKRAGLHVYSGVVAPAQSKDVKKVLGRSGYHRVKPKKVARAKKK